MTDARAAAAKPKGMHAEEPTPGQAQYEPVSTQRRECFVDLGASNFGPNPDRESMRRRRWNRLGQQDVNMEPGPTLRRRDERRRQPEPAQCIEEPNDRCFRVARTFDAAIVRSAIDVPGDDRDARLTTMMNTNENVARQVGFQQGERISRLAPPCRSVEPRSTIAPTEESLERLLMRVQRRGAPHRAPPPRRRMAGPMGRPNRAPGSGASSPGSGSGSGGGRATEPARRRARPGERRVPRAV
jgi:hypothetical protein